MKKLLEYLFIPSEQELVWFGVFSVLFILVTLFLAFPALLPFAILGMAVVLLVKFFKAF